MRVMVINQYGSLDNEGWKPTRSFLLLKTLAEAGFFIEYVISSFQHKTKTQRSMSSYSRHNIRATILRSTPYHQNIGLARLFSELVFALQLLYYGMRSSSRPDVIVCGHATLFTGLTANVLARRFKAALVIDMFDLWPEVFKFGLPVCLRDYSNVILRPLFALRRYNFAQADAIIALSRINLEIAAGCAPRLSKDRLLLVYEGIEFCKTIGGSFCEVDKCKGENYLESLCELGVVFAGSLGDGCDVHTMVAAARILESHSVPVKIFVAGDGPQVKVLLREDVRNIRILRYLGSLNATSLSHLYQKCQIGLVSYVRGSTVAMPCKVFDYTAAGLAVVSSLGGELLDIIKSRSIGFGYRAGDPDELASLIIRFAYDRKLLSSCCCNSHLLAAEFDRRRQYAPLVDLLNCIHDSRSRQCLD